MTAFPCNKPLTPNDTSAKQIEELQHAIRENTRKLAEVKQKRQCVEEEIIHSRRETQRRVELMMVKGEIVDSLHQLGCLLQEEMHLQEQLNDQAASDRLQMSILEERSKSATAKARSLAAEIQEGKERLAEIKARKRAAQGSSPMPTSKSKGTLRKK